MSTRFLNSIKFLRLAIKLMRPAVAALLAATFALGETAAGETAARELSAFEKALQMNGNLSTKETIVQNGARKFRRIEIQTEIFYLQLQNDLATAEQLTLLCGENKLAFGANSPALVTGAVRVTKRTRFFIEGLRTLCRGTANHPRIDIAAEIAIGFMLDDDPDPRALLKNRRISIDPFAPGPSMNFNAEF